MLQAKVAQPAVLKNSGPEGKTLTVSKAILMPVGQ